MAEIGLDNHRIGGNLRRRTLGNDLAFRQHEDLFGEAHHRLHDVLDHHDGDAARAETADDRHDVADFGRVEARQHLVEEQQLRFDCQGARKLKPLAPGDRERIGRPVKLSFSPTRRPTSSATASAAARPR